MIDAPAFAEESPGGEGFMVEYPKDLRGALRLRVGRLSTRR
jgi:hypothetical protein